jgi:GNAT superfamily N-acetyltransferase
MVKGPTIRRALTSDYDVICELADQMDAPLRANLPDRFRRPEGAVRRRDQLEHYIADENTFIAIAELEGRPVGVVNSCVKPMPDFPQKQRLSSMLVRGIVVRDGSRRQGIGTALFQAAQEWAASHGATEVQANVYDFDKATLAFLEHLGFAPLSHRLARPLCDGTR